MAMFWPFIAAYVLVKAMNFSLKFRQKCSFISVENEKMHRFLLQNLCTELIPKPVLFSNQ